MVYSHFVLKIIKYLAVVCILFVQSAYSQISGTYSFDCEPYKLYLYLDDSNKYFFEREKQETEDIIGSIVLSMGDYKFRSDTLFLFDLRNSYSMIFKKQLNILMVIKGFYFIQNQYLYFEGDWYSEHNWIFEDTLLVRPKKLEYEKMKNKVPLRIGYYKSYGEYNLEIMDNNNYVYYIDFITISKGKWSQKESTLILQDSILDCSFYLLIKDDFTLKSQILPGEYFDIDLNRTNYDKGWP
jgi:hypothetical protein